jgi:hypothetical protein
VWLLNQQGIKQLDEAGGLEVVQFRSWFYRRLANMGLEGAMLDALDRGGFAALVELLTA